MIIKYKKLHDDAIKPRFANATDSGFDLFTCEDVKISPRKKAAVSTGIAFELPKGYGIQIKNKSGITLKGCPVKGNKRADITVFEGTIDNEYRGEVQIMIKNESFFKTIVIPKGTKLAQGLIKKIYPCEFKEVEQIDQNSTRGSKGFGSSGTTA